MSPPGRRDAAPLSTLGTDAKEQIRLLESLVNTDSPTGGPGIDAVFDLLESATTGIGLTVERIPTAGPAVMRAHNAASDDKPSDHRPPGHRPKVLMVGHVDTVFPAGTAAERPFTIVGERAYGPGIADMKAGLVVMLAAVAQLSPKARDNLDITVLFNGDEEIGSPDSRAVIEGEARGAKAALVFESARRTGAIVTARRGVRRYRLDVTGRAAHSGTNPEAGANALETLAHIILGVQTINREVSGASVTAVLAQGGSRPNIVPDAATLHIDCRFDDVHAEALVRKRVEELTGPGPVDGTAVRLTSYGGRPPFGEPATQLARTYVSTGRELGIDIETAVTGGGSDANFTAALGIPTIDGLGAVGGGAHTVDEYIEVATLAQRAAVCARLLSRLAE